MTYDVFISHSSKDKLLADAVCAALEAKGVRCWIAPRDILASESWPAAILRGISESRMMVLIFSANANGSQHVHREVERAVAHTMPVLPVRVEDVVPAAELEYFLSSAHWLNAMTEPFQQHLQNLAATVGAVLETRRASPAIAPTEVSPARRAGQIPPTSTGPSLGAVPRQRRRAPLILAICGVLALTLAVAAGVLFRDALYHRIRQLRGSGSTVSNTSPMPAPSMATTLGQKTTPASKNATSRPLGPKPGLAPQDPAPRASVAAGSRTQPVSAPAVAAAPARSTPILTPNPLEQATSTQLPATQTSVASSVAAHPDVKPMVPVVSDGAAHTVEVANQRDAEQRALAKIAADKAAADKLAAEKLARTTHISELLSVARSNDSAEKGQTALTALNEVLTLDPNNAEAQVLQKRIAAYYAKEITNSLNMKFVRIEPGEFIMGTPASELGHAQDETQHRVKISAAFMLGVYPVTQAQWTALMGDNPSSFAGNEFPVEKVSWDDALKFCQKLSSKEQKRYRLPTEAEWEYACRAGTDTPFYFGATITSDMANYDAKTAYGNGPKGVPRKTTTQVGTFKPNAWGLYDMCGNVSQWCSDWYAPYPVGDAIDPTGPAEPMTNNVWHVLRGGSWGSTPAQCRSGARYKSPPDNRFNFYGFRVVLDPGPEPIKPPGN